MRNHIRYFGAFVLAVTVIVSGLLVSSPTGAFADETPGKKLLEKSVKAMGGEKKCASWKTMVETGELTVHWPGWGSPRAIATRSVKQPDKMVLDQDFSAFDHPFFFTYYYNAGDVWAIVNLGVRQHPRYTSFMTRAMKDTRGVYYYVANCDTFFVVPEVPDDSLVVGSTIDRVGIVEEGDTIIVDLDKETHLPVRQIIDGGSQHVLFDNWKQIDGLKRPFHLTVYQNGAISAEYTWEKIEFDVPLADDLFEENRPPKNASG
jgi:hypothetical protein